MIKHLKGFAAFTLESLQRFVALSLLAIIALFVVFGIPLISFEALHLFLGSPADSFWDKMAIGLLALLADLSVTFGIGYILHRTKNLRRLGDGILWLMSKAFSETADRDQDPYQNNPYNH